MRKKVAVILTAAVLSVSPALADPVSDLISDHNRNRFAAGAAEITGSPEIENGTYTYHLSDNIIIEIATDGSEIKGFSCVCLDDSAVGEFLAQCVTAFYDIGGIETYIKCHDPLLTDFLAARAGLELESNSSIPGVLFQVQKLKNGRYIFIIVKVK